MVAEDDETSKEKEIDKLMALISLSFKKIYKPTNNNLRTSSNTSRTNQDNSPRINKSVGYENQRNGNVARARENGEAEIQLNAEKADWRDDTDDDELEDQELEAHYMYMAQLQEVSLDAADSRPIFNDEPLQKVSNDDHYNVFSMESVHLEQSKPNDDDNDLAKERELLVFLIEELICEIDKSKNRNKFLETSNKEDRVTRHSSQGTKQEVEDHRRSVKLSKNKTSVTACNDNLNAKTLNVKSVCATCDKCVLHDKHDMCVLKSVAKPLKETVASESNKKPRNLTRKLYERVSKTCSWWSKDETPEVPINFLRLVQRGHQAQVRVVRTDKGTKFLNHTLHAYFAAEGILHQTSVARTPGQNGVVKRRNRTLVEAAQTMLSAAKVSLFFWAEAIATACFTQNRSLVIPRHEKTPYHIINDWKPSVKFFHIVGSICYIVRDGANLDKMKEKGDECIVVGYSTQSRAYRVFNKRTKVIMESIHVNFDELPLMASDQISSDPTPE
nr:hypothetical protein [Tanacetum cinerariifolium]